MMMFKTITIFLVFICFLHLAPAQEKKLEREKRIKREEVPANILDLVENYLGKAKKVRYFFETDGDHMSFEIKFLLDGCYYSVEFDKNGNLEDVEVIVSFRNLEKERKKSINSHLDQYDNFKVKKVQKQFSSKSEPDKKVIENAIQNIATETVRYEIIVETKTSGSWTVYEMLFDDKGGFISQKEVVGRLEDNILY